MKVSLGLGAYWRRAGHLPRLRLKNMFIEKDPTNTVDGLVRLPRPATVPFATMSDGSFIDYVWRQSGVLGGDYLVFAGGTVFRMTQAGVATDVGTVPMGRPSIAARQADCVIAVAGLLFSYDGTDLAPIVTPDDVPIGTVATLNQYYYLTAEGTRRFYWIEPGELEINPLNFAEAERKADNIIAVAVVGEEVWFLKDTNEEVWGSTGDVDAPIQRLGARAYAFGCSNRDTVVVIGTMLCWVSKNNEAIVAMGSPKVISNPAISEHIRRSPAVSAWSYVLDQHTFYIITTATGSFAFDFSAADEYQWSELATYGSLFWRAHTGAQDGAQIVVGSSAAPKLWLLDPSVNEDDGSPLEREITGGVELVGTPEPCYSLSIRAALGVDKAYDEDCWIEVCWSDDEGATWGKWDQLAIIRKGEYSGQPVLRSLGTIHRPGRLFRFRCTEPMLFRINYAHVNEA